VTRALLVLEALAALAAASPARADGAWGSIELRASAYRPALDAEFAGSASPYADAFGRGRAFLGGVHAGCEVWRGFGVVELGLGAAYAQRTGHGHLEDGSVSADTTTLHVVPLALTLTWRVEEVRARLGVPLVPYVRLSLVRDVWWTQDGNGATSSWSDRRGIGATDGWETTAGLAFPLDVLDPTLSTDLRRDVGIYRTYLFADATHGAVDDFGSRRSWNLSDPSAVRWSGGLLFTF
jgi:hypothetical protein